MSHAAYKHDSNISEELNYIIIETCNKISRLEIGVRPNSTGQFLLDTIPHYTSFKSLPSSQAPGLLDAEANDSATLPRMKRELSESGNSPLSLSSLGPTSSLH
jgi:hypothetical protein